MADRGFINPVLIEELFRLGLITSRSSDSSFDLHNQNSDTKLDEGGANEVTAAECRAAADASHDQGTDGYLDRGGVSEVTAAQVKTAVDASHDQNTDTKLDDGGTNEVTAAEIKTLLSSNLCAYYQLGAPALSVVDAIVASEAMDNKSYTLTASPYTMDVPRNVTITRTVNGGADTPGEILVTGTNIDDEVITETIIPGATGVTVAGEKAFKTVTDVTGSGWTIADTADDLTVGFGDVIGCHVGTDDADNILFGMINGAVAADNASVDATGVVELTTVDFSAATYDGLKEILIFQAL